MKVITAGERQGEGDELVLLLQQEPDIELCAVDSFGPEFSTLAEEFRPDAVFLDIDLDEAAALQAARLLSAKLDGPLLILVSSAERHAVEAFELRAFDFLLKPYSHLRFQETVRRLRSGFKPQKASNRSSLKLLVNDGERISVIAPESILAVVKEDKNVIIHTKDGKSIVSKSTLQELEEKLSDFDFFRPHRSYLINLNEVEELTPWFNGAYNIKLRSSDGMKVPVSRDSAKELFRRLGGE